MSASVCAGQAGRALQGERAELCTDLPACATSLYSQGIGEVPGRGWRLVQHTNCPGGGEEATWHGGGQVPAGTPPAAAPQLRRGLSMSSACPGLLPVSLLPSNAFLVRLLIS